MNGSSNKTLLIIGASSGIGLATLREALRRGYRFKGFARSAERIVLMDAKLEKITGDATSAADVRAALVGTDAVVLALGIPAGPQMVLGPVTLFSQATHVVVEAAPGKLSVGTIGVGSFHHVTMEAVMAVLGIKFNHVPFKGSGETVAALRGGHLDLVIAAYPGLLAAVNSNQAKLIAANSPTRAAFASDIPAIAETIPGFDLAVIQGFYTRVGAPAEVVNQLADALAQVVKEPEVAQKFTAVGIEPAFAGPAEMAKLLAAEGERVAKVVKAAGIKPE